MLALKCRMIAALFELQTSILQFLFLFQRVSGSIIPCHHLVNFLNLFYYVLVRNLRCFCFVSEFIELLF